MSISGLAVDLAFLALYALGDLAVLLCGALIAAAAVDGLVSIVQLIRR